MYNSLPLKLDMNIVVEMDYINNKHLPLEIYYQGYWNVLFLKPEYAEFRLKIIIIMLNKFFIYSGMYILFK